MTKPPMIGRTREAATKLPRGFAKKLASMG
jgi:hypothetical protein